MQHLATVSRGSPPSMPEYLKRPVDSAHNFGSGSLDHMPRRDESGRWVTGRNMEDLIKEAYHMGFKPQPQKIDGTYGVENFDFPDAFDQNENAQVLIARAEMRSGWISVAMPYVIADRLDIGMDYLIFRDTAPDRLPEEAVPSYMTSERRQWSDSLARWGKGIRMERSFFHTPFGRAYFYWQVEQLNNAIAISMMHSALSALYYDFRPAILTRPQQLRQEMIARGRATSVVNMVEATFDTWGFLNRDPSTLASMMNRFKEEFSRQSNGGRPDRVVCPQGAENTWRFLYKEKQPFFETGYRIGQMPDLRQMLHDGMAFCESFSSRMGDGRVDHDPAYRHRTIGGYFTCSANNYSVSPIEEYKTSMLTNEIFNEDLDQIQRLMYASNIKYTGTWENFDECDALVNPKASKLSQIGRQFFEGVRTYYDAYQKDLPTRGIQELTKVLKSRPDFLLDLQQMSFDDGDDSGSDSDSSSDDDGPLHVGPARGDREAKYDEDGFSVSEHLERGGGDFRPSRKEARSSGFSSLINAANSTRAVPSGSEGRARTRGRATRKRFFGATQASSTESGSASSSSDSGSDSDDGRPQLTDAWLKRLKAQGFQVDAAAQAVYAFVSDTGAWHGDNALKGRLLETWRQYAAQCKAEDRPGWKYSLGVYGANAIGQGLLWFDIWRAVRAVEKTTSQCGVEQTLSELMRNTKMDQVNGNWFVTNQSALARVQQKDVTWIVSSRTYTGTESHLREHKLALALPHGSNRTLDYPSLLFPLTWKALPLVDVEPHVANDLAGAHALDWHQHVLLNAVGGEYPSFWGSVERVAWFMHAIEVSLVYAFVRHLNSNDVAVSDEVIKKLLSLVPAGVPTDVLTSDSAKYQAYLTAIRDKPGHSIPMLSSQWEMHPLIRCTHDFVRQILSWSSGDVRQRERQIGEYRAAVSDPSTLGRHGVHGSSTSARVSHDDAYGPAGAAVEADVTRIVKRLTDAKKDLEKEVNAQIASVQVHQTKTMKLVSYSVAKSTMVTLERHDFLQVYRAIVRAALLNRRSVAELDAFLVKLAKTAELLYCSMPDTRIVIPGYEIPGAKGADIALLYLKQFVGTTRLSADDPDSKQSESDPAADIAADFTALVAQTDVIKDDAGFSVALKAALREMSVLKQQKLERLLNNIEIVDTLTGPRMRTSGVFAKQYYKQASRLVSEVQKKERVRPEKDIQRRSFSASAVRKQMTQVAAVALAILTEASSDDWKAMKHPLQIVLENPLFTDRFSSNPRALFRQSAALLSALCTARVTGIGQAKLSDSLSSVMKRMTEGKKLPIYELLDEFSRDDRYGHTVFYANDETVQTYYQSYTDVDAVKSALDRPAEKAGGKPDDKRPMTYGSEINAEVVGNILKQIPIDDARVFKLLLNHDLPVFLGYIGYRPEQTYEMGTMILMKDGAGGTYYIPPEVAMGEDPRDLVMHCTVALYYKGMLHGGEGVLRIPDVYCRRYIGGNGVQIWDPLNPIDVSIYNNPSSQNKHHKHIFLVPEWMHRDHDSTWLRDITGKFPDAMDGTAHEKRATEYSVASVLQHIWQWSNSLCFQPDSYDALARAQPRHNTVVAQDHQGLWDGKGGYTRVIRNQGAWGSNVYDGVRRHREGGILNEPKYQFDAKRTS